MWGENMPVRWMVERNAVNKDCELLQVVEVYSSGENKETVKKENRQWTYRRSLVFSNQFLEKASGYQCN